MDRVPAAWAAEGPARPLRVMLQRFGHHPGASWSLSWIALFVGGIWIDPTAGPPAAFASCILVALFAGFTWIGALAFADRHAPLWILPAAVAFGVARGLVAVAIGPGPGDLFALLFEPAALLAAAAIVYRAELLDEEPGVRTALTTLLGAVALLEVADGLAPLVATLPDARPVWLVVAPATAFVEVGAMWFWIARRELRIERAELGQRVLEDAVARERRTSDLLRRKEAWLFDFFEKAPDLLLVLAPGTCEILRCNRRFSETLGHARRDLVGRSLLELVDPRALERVRPILESRRRRVRNLLLHLRRHDGSEVIVLANLAVRSDPGGESEVRAVLHDVTRLERSGVESELRRSLSDHAAAGLFHADDEGRCAAVNASFTELTGLSGDQAREVSWLVCVHPEDRRVVDAFWRRAVRDGAVFRLEHRVVDAAGRTLRVVTECVPADAADGGGFVGSMMQLPAPTAPASAGATPRPRPLPHSDGAARREPPAV